MSLRTFNETLYREHFEELTSMSELRSAWMADQESPPEDAAGLDERIEAHLDALVLGGEAALAAAWRGVRPGEPWTSHAWEALARRVAGLDMPRDARPGPPVQASCTRSGER